jgi:outer membrane murein-binding lipoprotein Lpp
VEEIVTRTALLVAAVAIAAAALSGCGGDEASDAGPSASSTFSARVSTSEAATGSTEPAAEAAPPADEAPVPTASTAPGPSAAPPVADPCAEVTREYLITTLRMTGMPRYSLSDLQQARCSGTFASATAQPEGTLHPVMYLFEYSEQNGHTHWHVIDVGEGLDCVNRHGVPADVGSEIGCAI